MNQAKTNVFILGSSILDETINYFIKELIIGFLNVFSNIYTRIMGQI